MRQCGKFPLLTKPRHRWWPFGPVTPPADSIRSRVNRGLPGVRCVGSFRRHRPVPQPEATPGVVWEVLTLGGDSNRLNCHIRSRRESAGAARTNPVTRLLAHAVITSTRPTSRADTRDNPARWTASKIGSPSYPCPYPSQAHQRSRHPQLQTSKLLGASTWRYARRTIGIRPKPPRRAARSHGYPAASWGLAAPCAQFEVQQPGQIGRSR